LLMLYAQVSPINAPDVKSRELQPECRIRPRLWHTVRMLRRSNPINVATIVIRVVVTPVA